MFVHLSPGILLTSRRSSPGLLKNRNRKSEIIPHTLAPPASKSLAHTASLD